MSSDVALRAEHLSKRYLIGQRQQRYKTLREAMVAAFKSPFARLRGRPGGQGEDLWALDDVSFDVARGEVVGIIGANGAGKSTLLKILSRITEPTTGRAEIRGRVGSLLEVGTGFHPELTGRENTYLNGAILGMRRTEIDGKIDEIVAFAEIERFLDTAVKHYSSGMYLRLAFAVAAHLDTENLLVDEVLAVGDARFQRRCLQKMGDVGASGRTVLFVSHNLQAIQTLCPRTLWLADGRVNMDGETSTVVSAYLRSTVEGASSRVWTDPTTAPGNDTIRLRSAEVIVDGPPGTPLTMRSPLRLRFEYWNLTPSAILSLSVHVFDEMGTMAFNTAPVAEPEWFGRPMPIGLFASEVQIPGDLLNSSTHRVEALFVHSARHVVLRLPDLLAFDVLDTGELHGDWHGRWPGIVHPQLAWSTTLLEEGTC